VKHEAVYVSTDPVALDTLGAELVDKLRAEAKLPDLKSAGRDPSYIRAAGMLGLGMHERDWISLREVTLSG
jgi:hypothetical protein